MIAKLSGEGRLIPCPQIGVDAFGRVHTNLRRFYELFPGVAARDGFYPVRFTDKPEGNYVDSFELRDNEIVQVWTEYTPEPEPPEVDLEKLRSDVDYIAMMTDVDLEV